MKYIIGNWKMNGTMDEKKILLKSLKNIISENKIILCLPYTLLCGENYGIDIGAQDLSPHENGAYTGDISGKMLKSAGVKYVLVGHSDRRFFHHETNELVKEKAIAAIKNNIVPIICIGETRQEKDDGKTMSVIKKMFSECVPESGKYIIAYEPRWAIGTGQTPTPKEISAVFETLHKMNKDKAPLLYGGSVNTGNAESISSLPHVDGLLIGGASLKVDTFLPIINSAK